MASTIEVRKPYQLGRSTVITVPKFWADMYLKTNDGLKDVEIEIEEGVIHIRPKEAE